jgi:hypothetical protein
MEDDLLILEARTMVAQYFNSHSPTKYLITLGDVYLISFKKTKESTVSYLKTTVNDNRYYVVRREWRQDPGKNLHIEVYENVHNISMTIGEYK